LSTLTHEKSAPGRAPFTDAPVSHPPGADPPPASPPGEPRSRVHKRATPLSTRGEPYVWLMGSGLAAATLMIVTLLALVIFNGTLTFWPAPLVEVTLRDGTKLLGEVTRTERYRPTPEELAAMPAEARRRIEDADGWSRRRMLRTGNFDVEGNDFHWVADTEVVSERRPDDAWLVERREWGPAIGYMQALTREGQEVATGSTEVRRVFDTYHDPVAQRVARIRGIEKGEIGDVNDRLEKARLATRKAAITYGEDSARHHEAAQAEARIESELSDEYANLQNEIERLRTENAQLGLKMTTAGGRLIPVSPSNPDRPMRLSQVVRAYPANRLGSLARLGVYLDRWGEFLSDEPREANTEGGVFPAIFGTFMMTVMMSIAVAPFGVMAALYLREYARQGTLVSTVRIAVNNLAGVPSIVYGVFGLGFFCYVVGGTIDSIFFRERLPSPTFGTGGILWASLTLALLTVPVVIVATEEAIAAVPRSMREGSFACGASKWQTIRRIVLPRATPGIMTGLILAMARGAGEVAPLMITGVVKLAPALPFDGHFPYFHLERSFMHLGFHIYDVGFQSRNSEAGKPMVFTTTLLLIGIVALLNLTAIALRTRLKRRFKADNF